jgi:hypothetical protein
LRADRPGRIGQRIGVEPHGRFQPLLSGPGVFLAQRNARRRTIPSAVLTFLPMMVAAGCMPIPAGPITRDVPRRVSTGVLTRAEMAADLRTLAATVRATAPEGSLPVPAGDIEAAIARQAEALPLEGSRRQLLPAAMEIAGLFRSRHVYVVFPHEDWNLATERGERLLVEPMALDDSALTLEDGRQVIAIGGRSAREFTAWFRAAYGGANPLQVPERFRRQAAAAFWIWGVSGVPSLAVQTPHGGTEQIRPVLAAMQPRRSFFHSSGGASSSGGIPIRFTEAASGRAIVLSAPTFDPRRDKEWREVIAALDTRLTAGGVDHLVIDLRGNPGGSGRIGTYLLELLSGRQLAQSGGKRWKRSPEYERGIAELVPAWLRWAPWRTRLLGTDGASMLDAIPLGQEARVEPSGVTPDSTIRARIRTTVLIDGGVGSSATQFARAVQYHRLGELVGTPASDGTAGLGEIAFFRMPHSRLVFASPSAAFLDVGGSSVPGPLMPDVLVCRTNRAMFAAEFALDVALDVRAPAATTVQHPRYAESLSEADYCARSGR